MVLNNNHNNNLGGEGDPPGIVHIPFAQTRIRPRK